MAVSIQNLTKVYPTTEGGEKRAVDGLTLDMYQGHITALLGAHFNYMHSVWREFAWRSAPQLHW